MPQMEYFIQKLSVIHGVGLMFNVVFGCPIFGFVNAFRLSLFIGERRVILSNISRATHTRMYNYVLPQKDGYAPYIWLKHI